MYCKHCGAYLPDGAAACSACGCLLTPPPAPEAPAAGPKEGPALTTAPSEPEASGIPAPQLPESPAPEVPGDGLTDGPVPARQAPAPEGPAFEAPAAPPPVSGPVPGSVPPPRYQVPAYARPAAGPETAGPVNGAPRPAPITPPPGSCPPPSDASLSPTVGVWEWLWSSIVASIPIVGFIVLLVWAFKSSTKPSKRNWARSYLIFFLIVAVVYILLIGAAIVIHAMFAGPSFSPLVDPRYNAYY